jgi:hypothetical protein
MLIRVPDSWPHGLVAVLAMLVLAVIDLAGAYAAKEAVLRRSLPMAVVGVGLFTLLFWVYASSLRYADLAPVTLGWVVLLQVGVVLLDRFRYGTPVSRGQWAAVVVLLAAQAYLLLAPSVGAATEPPSTVAATAAAEAATLDDAIRDDAIRDDAILDASALDTAPLDTAALNALLDADPRSVGQASAGRYSSTAFR